MRLTRMRLTIAARKSDLARIQAYMVGDALKKNDPNLEITYRFSSSLGDKNQHDPLWKMPEQGVFTKDFVADLKNGAVDMVVHSFKDLPTQSDGSTLLAAALKRADHRDLLLLTRSGFQRAKASRSLTILSSSPRRSHNLRSFLPKAFPGGLENVSFDPVRGNIQTRLNKMHQLSNDAKADGLVVAKAAIDRLLSAEQWSQQGDDFFQTVRNIKLAVNKCLFMVLPASHNPAAAAQGAIAIEIGANRSDLKDILSKINCVPTFEDVSAERKLLAFHGGGCHQKIGVWIKTRSNGTITSLRGVSEDGTDLQNFSLACNTALPSNIKQDEICPTSDFSKLFSRQPVPTDDSALKKIAKAEAIFLASSNIPDDYLTDISNRQDRIIWASGVASWFKFAKKNIWINGVDDNLGSANDRQITPLIGKTPDWLTLSHDKSPAINCLPTYRLLPDVSHIDIDGKNYFYWRSGTAFLRALELAPQIANAIHGCGLGRTFDIVQKTLGEKARIFPFVSEQDWQAQLRVRIDK